MKFGFNVPVRGPGADPVGMTEIARRAESLGYDYIAVTDHISVPRNINSRYPYTENGMVPDLVLNPYGYPKRMTVAQFLEILLLIFLLI